MRVLVTGAAGFLGYAVAALLVEQGHDVTGLTRSGTSAPPTGVARLTGDPRTPETLVRTLTEVDGVCHLAGLTKVRTSRTAPLDYWRTNVGGTVAILDGLASSRAGRLVLASTCAVYGEQAAQPTSETAALAPSSPYATSKLAADQASRGPRRHRSDRSHQPAGLHRRRSPARTPRPRQDPAHPPTPSPPTGPRARAGHQRRRHRGPRLRARRRTWPPRSSSPRARTSRPIGAPTTSAATAPAPCMRDRHRRDHDRTTRPRRHTAATDEPARLLAGNTRIRSELGWRPERPSLHKIISDAWTAVNSD